MWLLAIHPSVALGSESASDSRLSLAAALAKAQAESPRLSALDQQVKADGAMMLVDEGYANPRLSGQIEDFLGTGVARRVDSTQVTVALSQELQLGGKPTARYSVKRARRNISRLQYRLVEHELKTAVAMAFLNVLAEQERLKNAQNMSALARQTAMVVNYQVEAGKASPIEADKAAIAQSLRDLSLEESRASLRVARQALAEVCGQDAPFFEEVRGSLDQVPELPALTALRAHAERHPALLLQKAKGELERSLVTLDQARRVPDLTVSLGARWINATHDRALVAGVEMPLPVIDRQRGLVQAGRHLTIMSERLLQLERLTHSQARTQGYQRLVVAHRRALMLRNQVSPKVRATYEAVREGYRIGRFGYLDLLDAQKALFDVEEQALNAVVAYHRTYIELSREAGSSLALPQFEVPRPAGEVSP